MREYDVTITETLEKTIPVKAESKDAAVEQARQGYFNSEYVLDADNFSGVEFSSNEGKDLTRGEEKIDVLLVEPGKPPRPYRIGTELEDLQAAVGGYIQVVYPFDEKVGIICNDEGKLIGLPLNRALRDEKGEIYDILAGNFLITGLTEESFGSLTPDQMQRYEKRFHLPELFVKMGKGIIAVPLEKNGEETLSAEGKKADIVKKSPPAQDAR